MDIPLQPLRITSGWRVEFNDGLYEIDPDSELIPEDKRIWFFKDDLLQLWHERLNRVLDVGWYPSGDLVAGQYVLKLLEGDFLEGRCLFELRTRDRKLLVAEIDRLLLAVSDGTI